MRNFVISAVVMMCVTTAGSDLAHAGTPHEGSLCKGNVVIDTVYQTQVKGSGEPSYEYFFQIRNPKNIAVKSSVELGGFPGTVSLFSRSLPGIGLDGNQNRRERFGKGSNSQINSGSVKVYYDVRMSTPGPYILVTNCKA